MKILLVGGTFDTDGGRRSGLFAKLDAAITDRIVEKYSSAGVEITHYNGGYYTDIVKILESTAACDVVFWMPSVPNDLPKLRDVKRVAPRTILINSKNNGYGTYSFQELVNRSLGQKANLTIEFRKYPGDENYHMLVFDPLGTGWYYGCDVNMCAVAVVDRMMRLLKMTRQPTIHSENGENPPSFAEADPRAEEFVSLIKEYAGVFHELIQPAKNVTRFLGNASMGNFRCTKGGFPSVRCENYVYMSRRNVDKESISIEDFVPVKMNDDGLFYFGDKKPSVDTPVQLRLYRVLPNIKYMLHAHVYAKDAPFTSSPVPCGALEEVQEVLDAIDKHYGGDRNLSSYRFNLIGHGCLIMGNTLEDLKNVPFCGRFFPEIMPFATTYDEV